MCIPWSHIFFFQEEGNSSNSVSSYTVSTVYEWFQHHLYCQGSNVCLMSYTKSLILCKYLTKKPR